MMRCTNPILSTFLGGMLMLAQACDQSPAGEKIAAKPDPGQNVVKVDVKKDEPAPAPSVDEEPSPGNIAPELPPPPGGRPGDEIPNNGPGYGGGSQGALQPIPTGDEDDDEEDDFGICGNGEQEVLRNTNKNCPHLLYGTTISKANGPSTLVYFNAGTGQGFDIATITNIHRVSAIDFSPEGVLYGVGVGDTGGDFANQSVFAQIDCQTGEATIIGPTRIEDVSDLGNLRSDLITDINFGSQGQLWAFLANQQYAGTINFSTGEFTQVTSTVAPLSENTQGNGLAFFPFPNNQLYTAGDLDLVLIDQIDGEAESSTPLTFPPDLTNPFINAMDNDPLNNTLYVSIQSDGQNNLGILDISISSATVSLIGTVPIQAPFGLDGLAVNRLYEECDTEIIDTTICFECQLRETNCGNGIDDDFDGLLDCADPDCLDRRCDDGDACTQGDFCTVVEAGDPAVIVFECKGTEQECNDLNPCTTDKCCDGDPTSPHFCPPPPGGIRAAAATCVFTNDLSKENVLGSCELDGHACTVGKCTTDVSGNSDSFICWETDRKFVQETSAICPHLLYGTTTNGPSNPSLLLFLDEETGQGTSLGAITNIRRVSAIDFRPADGKLYGVGTRTVAPFESVFAQIDCLTGIATIIGPTLIENLPHPGNFGPAITDINFNSQGELWAFLTDQQFAGTIDFATGAFTQVTPTLAPLDDNFSGNGLAFFPFPNDRLYTAGDSNVVLIDEFFGTGTIVSPLSFPLDLSFPRINAMDNDPSNNTLFVSIQSDGQNNLGTLDITNGNVSLVGSTPGPSGLDGLAVNRFINTGCLDANECTADSCVESWTRDGFASNGDVSMAELRTPWGSVANHDAIGNVILDNDWQCESEVMPQSPCFDAETCRDGLCAITGTGMPGDPANIECVASTGIACDVENLCPLSTQTCIDGFCADTACPDIDENECTNHFCTVDGCNTIAVADDTPCGNRENLCVENATCQAGVCTGAIIEPCPQDEDPCTINNCDPTTGSCGLVSNVPDGTPTGGGTCTGPGEGECANGELLCIDGLETCVLHTPVTEICDNGLDDDCDGNIDNGCPKLVFISNAKVTGTFGGVPFADDICQSEAGSGPRVFKAWISDDLGRSPNTTFNPANAPYKLANGTVIADDYNDLTDGSLQNLINLTIDGSVVTDNVWTGTDQFGDVIVNQTCKNWLAPPLSTNVVLTGFTGNSAFSDSKWTRNFNFGCGITARFYCFQQ